jgi:hypothetical protein
VVSGDLSLLESRLPGYENSLTAGNQDYSIATLAFYGPDDKKASKAVIGIILSKDAEAQLHKSFRESPDADLRYDIKLQNAWIEIIRREGVRSLADDRGDLRMTDLFFCPLDNLLS